MNAFLESHEAPYKIAVTYDSLEKLSRWINVNEYKLLIDEYHLILEDMDYRYSAIDSLMKTISLYSHFTFLSATPIDEELEIAFIKNLPHYKIEWQNTIKIMPIRYKVSNLTKGLANLINIFLTKGLNLEGIDGDKHDVKELYIFFNSVKSIKQICDTLELEPDIVKICCADKKYNHLMLGDYHIESVSSPNKTLNFFTKKCFQGCNLFTDNGLIIVASDAKKENTLVDISTTMEQIAGRIRYSEKHQNIFRDRLVHLYSTNKVLPSDEEFNEMMIKKEKDAQQLISASNVLNSEQLQVILERTDLEGDIVSIEDNKIVYNELKKQSFIYKQKLRTSYMDGIHITSSYTKSERFIPTRQNYWAPFEVALKKATTISYKNLLKAYIETKDDSYIDEYPEFQEINKFVSDNELKTLHYDRNSILTLINEKKQLPIIYLEIYKEGFVSLNQLKSDFVNAFRRHNITILSPKASLIEDCKLYEVKEARTRIENKLIRGYLFGHMIH